MKRDRWDWLRTHDELRYRAAQAMKTYLNHLEGAVDNAHHGKIYSLDAYRQETPVLATDEDIIIARLALLGSGR